MSEKQDKPSTALKTALSVLAFPATRFMGALAKTDTYPLEGASFYDAKSFKQLADLYAKDSAKIKSILAKELPLAKVEAVQASISAQQLLQSPVVRSMLKKEDVEVVNQLSHYYSGNVGNKEKLESFLLECTERDPEAHRQVKDVFRAIDKTKADLKGKLITEDVFDNLAEQAGKDRPALRSNLFKAEGKLIDAIGQDHADDFTKKVGGVFQVFKTHRPPKPLEEATLRELAPMLDSYMDRNRLFEKGTTIDTHAGVLTKEIGPRYSEIGNKVMMPIINAPIALHELGHAADLQSLPVLKSLAYRVMPSLALTMVPTALVAGNKIKKAIPGTVDDEMIDFVQNHAVGIGTAAVASMQLIPEASASMRAMKHLARYNLESTLPALTGEALYDAEKAITSDSFLSMLGAIQKHDIAKPMAALKGGMRTLMPAFGSYVVSLIPVVAGFSLAKSYFEHERQGQKKNASLADTVMGGKLTVKPGFNAAALKPWMKPRSLITTAVTFGVPAALTAYYLSTSPHGQKYEEQKLFEDRKNIKKWWMPEWYQHHQEKRLDRADEMLHWARQNPEKMAFLTGVGVSLASVAMDIAGHEMLRVL